MISIDVSIESGIIVDQKIPNVSPEDLMSTLNRKSFTANLTAEGKKLYESKLSVYLSYKYVALARDAHTDIISHISYGSA